MDLHIDRLTLRVPGLSRAEGYRLAELVGRGLSTIPPGLADGHSTRVAVDATEGERLEVLAARITSQVSASLRRSP